MKQALAQIALVVRDYDEAIRFYCDTLHFTLLEDTKLSETKRWVRVAPPGSEGCGLLLARAVGPEQESRIGNQSGGRVFLFLHTDNIDRDYRNLMNKGVRIIREPSVEAYGRVLVFADLYGNLWDLIQPSAAHT
jgi:catechol 2,3-dioxygenase-like lactoylglutathione lyase family enzyme